MATTVKKLEIEIDGKTVGFQKAMRQCASKSRALSSEIRGIDSLMKKDPLNSTLIAQKQQVLKESISQTENKLKALKASQDGAREAFEKGEISAQEYRKLEREIIASEQQLKKLKAEQLAFNASTSNLGMIGRKWELVGNKISGIGQKMKVVSAAGAVVAGAIGTVAYKAARAADDLNTMSKQYGLSTKSLQNYQSTAELVDVSVETLAKTHVKLKKNMLTASQSASGTAAKAFDALGIKVTKSNGHLRNANVVYDEAIQKLAGMKNETERDAYAMAIFGKSAADLNPLLEGGAEQYQKFTDLMRKNKLEPVSQEQLDKANEFNDAIDTIKATFQRASLIIGTKVAGYLAPIMENFADKFAAFAGKLAGMSGKTLSIIGGIAAAVAAVAPVMIVLGSAISNTGVVMQNLGRICPGLTSKIGSLFSVLSAHPIFAVIAAIAALVVIFGKLGVSAGDVSSKVQAVAESIVSKVNGFTQAISAHGAEFISAGITVVTALIQGIVQALPSVIAAVGQMVMAIVQAIGQNLPQIIQSIVTIVKTIASTIMTYGPQLLQAGLEIIVQIAQGIGAGLPNLSAKLPEVVQTIATGIQNNLPMILSAAGQIILALGTGIIQSLPILISYLPGLVRGIASGIVALGGLVLSAGVNLMERLSGGIRSGFISVFQTVTSNARAIPSRISSAVGSLYGIGVDVMTGFVNGIRSGFNKAFSIIESLGKKCKNALKKVFNVNSPSRFTMWIGQMLTEGLIVGTDRGTSAAVTAMQRNYGTMRSAMANAMLTAPAMPSLNMMTPATMAAAAGNVTIEQNFYLENNPSTPGDIMREAKKQAMMIGFAGQTV